MPDTREWAQKSATLKIHSSKDDQGKKSLIERDRPIQTSFSREEQKITEDCEGKGRKTRGMLLAVVSNRNVTSGRETLSNLVDKRASSLQAHDRLVYR